MRKIILSTLLTLLLFSPSYASEVLNDYFDIANNFYVTGEIERAKEYTNVVLKQNPEHYGANCLMLKLTPPKGFLQDKNFSSQIVIKSKDGNTDCKPSDEYNQKGQELYDKKEYQNACHCFLKSIELNPQNYFAYNNLGLSFQKLDDNKKAEKNYKKAISINKNYTIAYDNLAQMYIQQGKFKKAEKYLTKAIEINPKDYCAKFLYGIVAKNEKDYKKAIEMFNQVEQLSTNFAINYLYLAETYYQMGDYSWSNSSIEKYIQLCPKDDWGYYVMYRNHLMRKDYNIAKSSLIKAMRINNCIDYRIYLAELESLLKNPQGAIEALCSIPNKNGEILNELGINYLAIENYKKGLECFKQASECQNARLIYSYNLALVYKKLNDKENYKKTIETIKSTSPIKYVDYIDKSAIGLECFGKNYAIETINAGIKQYPKTKELYDAKLKIYTITSDQKGIETTEKKIKKLFK